MPSISLTNCILGCDLPASYPSTGQNLELSGVRTSSSKYKTLPSSSSPNSNLVSAIIIPLSTQSAHFLYTAVLTPSPSELTLHLFRPGYAFSKTSTLLLWGCSHRDRLTYLYWVYKPAQEASNSLSPSVVWFRKPHQSSGSWPIHCLLYSNRCTLKRQHI